MGWAGKPCSRLMLAHPQSTFLDVRWFKEVSRKIFETGWSWKETDHKSAILRIKLKGPLRYYEYVIWHEILNYTKNLQTRTCQICNLKKKPTQIGLFGLELQILCVPVKFRNNSYVNNVLRRPTLLQKVKPLNEIRNVIILYFEYFESLRKTISKYGTVYFSITDTHSNILNLPSRSLN